MNATIQRPHYGNMTIAEALAANWQGWQLTQKMDGVFAVREQFGAVLIGELMRGGDFFAFDVASIGGQDMRRCPMRERWQALQTFRQRGVQIVPTGTGGEFLEAVIANGGEGIVAANLDAAYSDYGARIKCKRVETFDCIVTDTSGGKMSVAVSLDGIEAGRVPIRNLTVLDNLKVGDVIEISAMARHQSGKFREPRFVRTRPDKSTT